MKAPILLTISALLLGCANTSFENEDAGATSDTSADQGSVDGWIDAFVGDLSAPTDGFQLGKARVFAHTATRLFEVDPDSFAVSAIADFVWPEGITDTMTDIALDKDGKMLGVSNTTVYGVDPQTARCTELASFPSSEYHFVGLSFIVDTSSTDEIEYLMGLDKEGAVYEIDPTTGATTQRGSLGGGLQAGGDVVSVRDFGTVATVKPPDSVSDWLAQVDPGNGKASLIGDTGINKVWGVGYWKGQVYGFAEGGEFVLIDVTTGEATLKESSANAWWGAGVTTEAPVID